MNNLKSESCSLFLGRNLGVSLAVESSEEFVVLDFLLLVDESGQLGGDLVGEGLQDGAHEERSGAPDDAGGVLLAGELCGLHCFTTELNKEDLKSHDSSHNNKEHPVGNQPIEHVVLCSADLPAVELVEDVQPDEGVEDHGEHDGFGGGLAVFVDFLGVVVLNAPHVVNKEVHECRNSEDVDSHAIDLFPHGRCK